MPSILDGLSTVQQSLAAQQFALSITQKNVANANNEMYTRQDVVFNNDWTGATDSGVPGISLKAGRDRYLDYSISQELQSLADNNVAYNALKQIDALMSAGNGQSIQNYLSDFFNGFSALSTTPEDLNLRQQVLSRANALAQKFQQLYGGIQQVQVSEDKAVAYSVDEINSITAKIADLNGQVRVAQAANAENQFTLRDDRQQLLEKLSGLVDLSYYETESGAITVTTRQGGLLVLEDQSHTLETISMANSSFHGVSLDGVDITATLNSGKLGGLIHVRDNTIAGYLSTLDDMAAGLIDRVNEQHADGIDLNNDVGSDLFTPFIQIIPGSNVGAARSMSVAITDPRQIAAASAGTGPGNNDNAKLLAAISDEKLFVTSTETANQFYAKLIYTVGSDEAAAEENITTQNGLLEQLKNQRDAFSGVNMDEEAVSIIKFQKAYQASARYANILESLSNEILNLVGA
jgi:flagellar hook-associated protein 1 FlgK